MRNANGFTLLEVLIAIAIMTMAFGSIFIVQSNSIESIRKAKETNLVTMLIKNLMIETEQEFEGRPFNEVVKEKKKPCQEPYQEYQCGRVIKEVKFPELSFGQDSNATDAESSEGGANAIVQKISKLITKFLSQSIREVIVTVSWGPTGEHSVSMSTYWVNLNQEFSINE